MKISRLGGKATAVLVMPWLVASALLAQSSSPKPRYIVHRVTTPIVVDGNVTPREWSRASGPIELIFPWDSQTGAKQKTLARLLWDDQYLYVSYQCDDADIVAVVQGRDEFVYRDDTVEIFLNVKPSQTGAYYCLEMNVLGTIMDYVCVNAQYYLRPFDLEGLKTGIKIDGTLNMRGDKDRGWSVELAIPWKNFSAMSPPPHVGSVFTAELNRWDGVEPNRRLSVWADPLLNWPHPHAPKQFGELSFGK